MYLRGSRMNSLRKRGVIWTQDVRKASWKEIEFDKRDDGGDDGGDGGGGGGKGPGNGNISSSSSSPSPSLSSSSSSGASVTAGTTGKDNKSQNRGPPPATSSAAPTPPQPNTSEASVSTPPTSQAFSITETTATTSTTLPEPSLRETPSPPLPPLPASSQSSNTILSPIAPPLSTPSPLGVSLSSSPYFSVSSETPATSSINSSRPTITSYQSSVKQSSSQSILGPLASLTPSTLITSTASVNPAASSSAASISTSLAPQSNIGTAQNGIASPSMSNHGKVVTAVAVVAGVGGVALVFAVIILFIRRQFRRRREGVPFQVEEPSSFAGPYHALGDGPAQMPARPRQGLRSWHESILWDSRNNSPASQSSNTLSTSEALATPTRWWSRVRSTFSNNALVGNNRFDDNLGIREKHTSPRRHQTFHSLPDPPPLFPAPDPVVFAERAAANDYPANEATPWTRGETTKGQIKVRKFATSANEMALERELERQGFSGSKRSYPLAGAPVLDLNAKRNSDANSDPPRWRTAVSWVRDQGERLGNRISFSATSRTSSR